MSGELGMRMGKGHWTEPERPVWLEGLPPDWTMKVRSHEQVLGMTTKVRELMVTVEITAPSGQVHTHSVLLADKLPEAGRG
jgi:hypothetical protein